MCLHARPHALLLSCDSSSCCCRLRSFFFVYIFNHCRYNVLVFCEATMAAPSEWGNWQTQRMSEWDDCCRWINRNNCFFQYTISIITCNVLFVFSSLLSFPPALSMSAWRWRTHVYDIFSLFLFRFLFLFLSRTVLWLQSMSNLNHRSLSRLIDRGQVNRVQKDDNEHWSETNQTIDFHK